MDPPNRLDLARMSCCNAPIICPYAPSRRIALNLVAPCSAPNRSKGVLPPPPNLAGSCRHGLLALATGPGVNFAGAVLLVKKCQVYVIPLFPLPLRGEGGTA